MKLVTINTDLLSALCKLQLLNILKGYNYEFVITAYQLKNNDIDNTTRQYFKRQDQIGNISIVETDPTFTFGLIDNEPEILDKLTLSDLSGMAYCIENKGVIITDQPIIKKYSELYEIRAVNTQWVLEEIIKDALNLDIDLVNEIIIGEIKKGR